ncbi:hypothetical protein PG993_006008 [Apiospora rasikravindrae]|uniref:F-box domain-containing protein n=1 Tax=Apiospora rasikravindrae TaxID=990691 RepID=A0ABR1TD27_9PEZI
MSLGAFPAEVVLRIASFAGQSDLNSLSRACRGFDILLRPQLYSNDRKGAKKALLWGVDMGVVGTVVKARQAGYDLNESWVREPESGYASAMPKELIFAANGEGNWCYRTALVRAIRNGHHAVARYMLDERVPLDRRTIDKTNYCNVYLRPIHHIILAAAEQAHPLDTAAKRAPWQNLLLSVLQKGVDANSLGILNEDPGREITPLGLSMRPECPWEITQVLLQNGANPTKPTGFWIWPDTVSSQPFQLVWQQLLNAEERLWDCPVHCFMKICLLLEYIPDLASLHVKNEPLLPLICSRVSSQRREFLSIVKSRAQGLDPNARNPLSRLFTDMFDTNMGQKIRDSEIRLEYARSAKDMLQTLLSFGANPDSHRDWPPLHNLCPPLHNICISGYDAPQWDGIVETLVDYGARLVPDTPHSRFMTPLHCVCLARGHLHLKRLEQLVQLGSSVNAVGLTGNTPLSILRRRNQAEPSSSLQAGMKILRRYGAVFTEDLSQIGR